MPNLGLEPRTGAISDTPQYPFLDGINPREINPKRAGNWKELLFRKGRFSSGTHGWERAGAPHGCMQTPCRVRRMGALGSKGLGLEGWHVVLFSAH